MLASVLFVDESDIPKITRITTTKLLYSQFLLRKWIIHDDVHLSLSPIFTTKNSKHKGDVFHIEIRFPEINTSLNMFEGEFINYRHQLNNNRICRVKTDKNQTFVIKS
jgi:hypothetical protein